MVAHAAILFSEEMGRGALLLRWLPCATHNDFAARWLAYMLPCRRFADVLADACARLGADVGRYSFIAVDFHHLLLAGLPAHSLALRPAHSRRHLYVTSYTEGFSHFVTSMTAPVASGWSGWPGGARTHWKAPPCHGAHVKRPLPTTTILRFGSRGCIP